MLTSSFTSLWFPTVTSPLMLRMMISGLMMNPSSSEYTWADTQAVLVRKTENQNNWQEVHSFPCRGKLPGVCCSWLCGFLLCRWCFPWLQPGAEPGHSFIQRLRCGQQHWAVTELQHSAQPHRVVVQQVRPGKPQCFCWRGGAEPGQEDTHPVGHLEAERSPSHKQVCGNEDHLKTFI